MGFKIPNINIPNIKEMANLSLPDVTIPEIPKIDSSDIDQGLNKAKSFINTNFPDLNNQIGEISSSFPDMNSMIPDMNSMMPSIDTSMASFDASSLTNSLEIPSVDINDLGIDLTSMQEMGVDTSELETQIDTSSLAASMEEIDISQYTSDLDISTQMEMPDMSIKGIAGMMLGVDDPTDINAVIQSKMSDVQPKDLKETLKSKAEGYITDKIPLLGTIKNVSSYIDTSQLDFSSIEAAKSNDYIGVAKSSVNGYVNAKIESVTPIINEVKEFASYADTSNMDFSSKDSIKSNDYVGLIKSTLKGYGNAKLDKLESSFDISNMMSDMSLDTDSLSIDTSEIMSEMDVDADINTDISIDTSELESYGIDTSQFNISSMNMNYDIPDLSESYDFGNPIGNLDMDSIGFDTPTMIQPLRDILNKYL